MYGIDPVDRLRTKLIAGRIVPAIATTTAAVAGFVSTVLITVSWRAQNDTQWPNDEIILHVQTKFCLNIFVYSRNVYRSQIC